MHAATLTLPALSRSKTHQNVDFPELFRTHTPYVWRVLRRLGVHERDIEDVAQDVFVTAHTNLHKFEGRSQIRTWVYGICINRARDYLRLARVRREIPTEILPDTTLEANQEQHIDQKNSLAKLDQMLQHLDEDKRAVFVLFDIEELPMEDVAQALECPVQTAYSRLYAARAELQSMARASRRKET